MCYLQKITIITVCYNAEAIIEKTMRSVCNQSYPNIEYLVIDGKSTDNSVLIAESIKFEYENKPELNIIIHSEKDKGIYDAMNKGIDFATGEWVIFMNAGDSFHSYDVVETIFRNKISSDIKAVYGDCERCIEDMRKRVVAGALKDIASSIPLPFCHQAIFVRTEVLKEFYFDINYKLAADYNFFVQCYLAGFKFLHFDLIICDYDAGGASTVNYLVHLKEKVTIREKNGLEHYSTIKESTMIRKLKIRKMIRHLIPEKIIRQLQGYK